MGFMDEVGANPPAMRWDELGETHDFTLTREPKKRQETDDDGNPKFFASGDPRFEWLFFGVDEDGEERTLYANWVLQKVLRNAFVDAGIHEPAAGVWIKIQRIADLPPAKPKHKPSKNYRARAEVRSAVAASAETPVVNDAYEDEIPF